MQTFFAVAVVVIAVGLVFSWIVGRFHSTTGAVIGLVAGFVARFAAVVALSYSIVKAVDRGGWFIALAALLVLTTLGVAFASAVTAGAIWLIVTGRASSD